MNKKPSKLTGRLVTKPKRSAKVIFGDNEASVHDYIRQRTAFDPAAIYKMARESDGVWDVEFRGGRRIRVFVGDHSSAPDFEVTRSKK